MAKATRIGDTGSGHGCHFPPSPATEGSPGVYVNGIPLGAPRRCLRPARVCALSTTAPSSDPGGHSRFDILG